MVAPTSISQQSAAIKNVKYYSATGAVLGAFFDLVVII